MVMDHVLLEMHCLCDEEENQKKPKFCVGLGHKCIQHKCSYLGCTYCPNEIAFAGDKGVVESFDDCIGFGGEMEPEEYDSPETVELIAKWKEICKNKIDEAYDEYMQYKNSKNNNH